MVFFQFLVLYTWYIFNRCLLFRLSEPLFDLMNVKKDLFFLRSIVNILQSERLKIKDSQAAKDMRNEVWRRLVYFNVCFRDITGRCVAIGCK